MDAPSSRSWQSTPIRALMFVFAAALSGVVVLAGAVLLVLALRPERAPISRDVAGKLDTLKRETPRSEPGRTRVLLIGDSVLGIADGLTVTEATRNTIAADPRGANVTVRDFWWPGLLVTTEWCLTDDFLEVPADRVVIEVNLHSLGATTAMAFGFPELAGRVHASRFGEALTLPLETSGITASRLLFDRALVASSLDGPWARLVDTQARLYNLWEKADRALENLLSVHSIEKRHASAFWDGLARYHVPGRLRERREHLEQTQWSVRRGVLPSYPPFVILGKMIRTFARAGKRPLLWAAPVNVDHIRSMGQDVTGFDRSIAALRSVVEENGGTLVDLHAALRDAELADAADHATSSGPTPGTKILGGLLADAILRTEAR